MTSLYRRSSSLAVYQRFLRTKCHHRFNGRQMSLFSKIRGALKTPESDVLDTITAVPFYELSKPPPQIQLNWLCLFLDAVFTGIGVDVAWRCWTHQVPADEEGAPPKHELRPANQRLALACLHVGVGSFVALWLFNVRRSHVRKLWLFPGSVPGNYRRGTLLPSLDTIVVENYSPFNPRVEFTLERTAYRFAGHKEDAILRLTPGQDAFVLLTQGVQIDGKPASRDEALAEILNPFQQPQTTNASGKTKGQSKKKKRLSTSTPTS